MVADPLLDATLYAYTVRGGSYLVFVNLMHAVERLERSHQAGRSCRSIPKHWRRTLALFTLYLGEVFMFFALFFMRIATSTEIAKRKVQPTTPATMPTMSAMLVSSPSLSPCLPTLSL